MPTEVRMRLATHTLVREVALPVAGDVSAVSAQAGVYSFEGERAP